MGFSLSAGVTVTELDFSSVVPAVSSSAGAVAGVFAWGPVLQPITCTSELDLIAFFGKPNPKNYVSFWSAANFLSYSGNMVVCRVDNNASNACAEPSGTITALTLVASSALYHSTDVVVVNNSQNGIPATATVTVQGGPISGMSPNGLHAGTGYSSGGTILISPPTGINGIQATADLIFTGGILTGVTITNPGNGYVGIPTYVITGISGGSGAQVNIVVGPSELNTIVLIQGGTGYQGVGSVVVGISNSVGTPIVDTSRIITVALISSAPKILNYDYYKSHFADGTITYGEFAAKYPGSLGSSITISLADAYNFSKSDTPTSATWSGNVATMTFTEHSFEVGSIVTVSGFTPNDYNGDVTVVSSSPTTITYALQATSVASASVLGTVDIDWQYFNEFDFAPGTSQWCINNSGTNDEMHIIVVDRTGAVSGVPGTVLEKFAYVSKAGDAKLPDGSNNYYVDVLNNTSKYIWWLAHPVNLDMVNTQTINWGQPALNQNFAQFAFAYGYDFSAGSDGLLGQEFVMTDAQQIQAYDLYTNQELFDISLIVGGKTSANVANYLIQNIAEVRTDCIAFISPLDIATGNAILGNTSVEIGKAVAFRGLLASSSYGSIDSGFKYQYDKYQDKYWWIPLNADIAGLCARTDAIADPWFSPGGYTRGQIKNCVKLSMNADKTNRDTLYKNGINPVVSFPGQGTILYGDKTMLTKPSAFDRINVRRLFIVLEKAISTAAKYQLFEMNDAFTRAQFVGMVTPFLRDVQGRRGIFDFRVKCDDTNNPGSVVDANQFVGDIYIKPARSINFINLSFIAARSDVNFATIGA